MILIKLRLKLIKKGSISIYNNGEGIDIEKHPEHKIYV